MKLRVKGDSLRLRLTRSEVAALDEVGAVEERVRFGAGAELVYRITTAASGSAGLTATFAEGVVEVRVPKPSVHQWATSNEVTLTGAQPIAGDDQLRIAVEKDFACLAPREGEDESDHFENPTTGTTC